MLARSFDRASKSTIDASVGAQEFGDAIRDATRKFTAHPKYWLRRCSHPFRKEIGASCRGHRYVFAWDTR